MEIPSVGASIGDPFEGAGAGHLSFIDVHSNDYMQ